jgi:hypothetical protein
VITPLSCAAISLASGLTVAWPTHNPWAGFAVMVGTYLSLLVMLRVNTAPNEGE